MVNLKFILNIWVYYFNLNLFFLSLNELVLRYEFRKVKRLIKEVFKIFRFWRNIWMLFKINLEKR